MNNMEDIINLNHLSDIPIYRIFCTVGENINNRKINAQKHISVLILILKSLVVVII